MIAQSCCWYPVHSFNYFHQSKQSKQPVLFHSHINTIFTNLYRPVLEIISFARNIPPVLHAEFITMQWTNYIAQGIKITIHKKSSCMRTLVRKGKQFISSSCNTNFAMAGIYFGNVVGTERKFGN